MKVSSNVRPHIPHRLMPVDFSALLTDWDPLFKILGALAAPGGLWFWYDKFRNRVRLKIRSAGLTPGDTSGRGLTLSVENVGSVATSTGPHITVVGHDLKRQAFRLNYRLIGQHAKLPPLDVVELTATHAHPENRTLLWAWYFTIKIPLSRGRTVAIRVRNAQFERLGFCRFHWERFLFFCLKRIPGVA